MSFTLTIDSPRSVSFEEYSDAKLKKHEVRIKTLFSGISAGTEMTTYLGSNPYLHKQWDEQERLFVDAETTWQYPMEAIGYEEVGEIVEVGSGVTQLHIGQIVWGVWGHRSTHIAGEEWVLSRLLPTNLKPICGIYSQMGAISLNAVLDASINIGEVVTVFGQGVPGLMVSQLAKASGATVIAVDRHDQRLEMAKQCGADYTINSAKVDVANRVRELSDGRGADASIEISGAYGALQDAIRCTAVNSKVVVSGFFQGEAAGLRLGEEFHHNRIELVCSQIGGLNRNLDHRWDRLRLDQTIMQLQAAGKVDFKQLVSHTFKAKDAQAAFTMLEEHPADALQVVLDFRD